MGGRPVKEVLEPVALPENWAYSTYNVPNRSTVLAVHANKDKCPLQETLCVDNMLVTVDRLDVQDHSAAKASRLIDQKNNWKQRLALVRTTREYSFDSIPLLKCHVC